MHLIFHGHRGQRHGSLARTYVRVEKLAQRPKEYKVNITAVITVIFYEKVSKIALLPSEKKEIVHLLNFHKVSFVNSG